MERGGRSPHLSNVLDFIIEHSIIRQDSRCSQDSASPVRNLLSGILHHVFVAGHRPSQHPPRVHITWTVHVPCPTLLFHCIILNTNQITKMGEAWEQGYLLPSSHSPFQLKHPLPTCVYFYSSQALCYAVRNCT